MMWSGRGVVWICVVFASLVMLFTPLFPLSWADNDTMLLDMVDSAIAFANVTLLSDRLIAELRLGFEGPYLWPHAQPLMLTDSFFGSAIVVAGFKLLGLGDLAAFNLFQRLIPVFNVVCFVILAMRLRVMPGLVLLLAGLVVVMPFPLVVPSHMHVSMVGFGFLILAGLWEAFYAGRPVWLIPVMLVASLAFYFGATLVIMMFATTVFFLVFSVGVTSVRLHLGGAWLHYVGAGLLSIILAGLVLLPFFWPYLSTPDAPVAARSLQDVIPYSLGLADPWIETARIFLGNVAIEDLRVMETPIRFYLHNYGVLAFWAPLICGLCLLGLGSDASWRPMFWPLLATIVVLCVVTFGPFVRTADQVHDQRLPYYYMFHVIPGLDQVRAIPRFLVLAHALSLVLLAMTLDACLRTYRQQARFALILRCVALATLIPLAVSRIEPDQNDLRVRIADWQQMSTAGAYLTQNRILEPILELPAPLNGPVAVRSMLHGVADGMARVNGVTSNFPPAHLALVNSVAGCPTDPACFFQVSQYGVRSVVVHLADHAVPDPDLWIQAGVRLGFDVVAQEADFLILSRAAPGPAVWPLEPARTYSASGADLTPALVAGWSGPEPWGRWMDGSEAQISALVLPDGPGTLQLDLTVGAFLVPGQPEVVVDVLSGETVIGQIRLSTPDPQKVTFALPDLAEGQLDVRLRPATTRSPEQEGMGADARQLSLSLIDLTLRRAPD